MKDLCTTCQCDNATINCTSETCPTVNCASPVIDPSQCCPVCLPGETEVNNVCMFIFIMVL